MILTAPTIRNFDVVKDSEIAIRIAHENFDAVDPQHKHYSKEVIDGLKKHWSPSMLKNLAEQQQRNERVILVADIESNVVGMAGLVGADIRMVFVKLELHRKGIGTHLIEAIEEIASRKGISKLTVSSSINAEEFYQKRGFKCIERLETPKGPEISMSIELPI